MDLAGSGGRVAGRYTGRPQSPNWIKDELDAWMARVPPLQTPFKTDVTPAAVARQNRVESPATSDAILSRNYSL